MPVPPIDWLREAASGRLEITGVNVWKAQRHRAYVQVLDKDGIVIEGGIPKLANCAQFRVTQRGHNLLEGKEGSKLPFSKSDPPLNIRLWLSSLRRWARNCPEGVFLALADGELRVFVRDTTGTVKDDDAHELISLPVPLVVKA